MSSPGESVNWKAVRLCRKKFMMERDIPTAAYAEFTQETLEAKTPFTSISTHTPIVLKADGLAGQTCSSARRQKIPKTSSAPCFPASSGAASARVVVEEFLDGIEFSVFVITNGKAVQDPAQPERTISVSERATPTEYRRHGIRISVPSSMKT